MTDNETRHYIIRVYGILMNSQNEVLLSDEYVHDLYVTKFPGGGLQFGEGPEDCIKREAIEEFGQEIEIVSHFYTTGFFQKALFYDAHQLISIYYKIQFPSKPLFEISKKPFDFNKDSGITQSFRWASVKSLKEAELTFPIDRYVLNMLKQQAG